MNTKTELLEIGKIMIENDIDKVILISSSTHISRCLRDALIVFEQQYKLHIKRGEEDVAIHWLKLLRNTAAEPSDTPYANSDVSMVQIFEPPHRGDAMPPFFHTRVARIFDVPVDKQNDFAKKLDALLDQYTTDNK